MRTKSLVIVIATLLVGVPLRGGGQETQPAPKPEMVLQADRLSDAVLDRVVAGTSADGRRTLRIDVAGHVDSTFPYYVIADRQAGTYRAFAVGDNPFEHPGVRAYLQERQLKLQGTSEWSRYAPSWTAPYPTGC